MRHRTWSPGVQEGLAGHSASFGTPLWAVPKPPLWRRAARPAQASWQSSCRSGFFAVVPIYADREVSELVQQLVAL
jgi:hypothetical protein